MVSQWQKGSVGILDILWSLFDLKIFYELHWHAFSFAGIALLSRVGNSDGVGSAFGDTPGRGRVINRKRFCWRKAERFSEERFSKERVSKKDEKPLTDDKT